MDARVDRARTAGFTLVELMIAVAVLAILTTSVTLAAYRPRSEAGSDPARFLAVFEALRSEAVLSRQVLGLALDEAGFRRLRREGGQWQADGPRADWHGAVVVIEPQDRLAPVEFAPSGQASPILVRFRTDGAEVVCTGGGWGELSCG